MSKIEGAYDHLATKADVAQLETKMGQIRSELVEKMGNLESRLTWCLLVGFFLQAGTSRCTHKTPPVTPFNFNSANPPKPKQSSCH